MPIERAQPWSVPIRKLLRWETLREAEPEARSVQELTRRLRQRCPMPLLGGPFKGMIYGDRSFESMHVPKLLGTYERELAEYFTATNLSRYTRILNYGCAEGYYANGCAFVLKRAGRADQVEVIGLDLDRTALAEARRIADWNDVDPTFGTAATPEMLATGRGRLLVICDVDGAEIELLLPASFPELGRTDFVVELHDPPGETAILDELRRRFLPSHECVTVEFQPRQAEDFPAPLPFQVAENIKVESMDERRKRSFRWLILNARDRCKE